MKAGLWVMNLLRTSTGLAQGRPNVLPCLGGLAGHAAQQRAVRGKPWSSGDEDLVVADGYPDRIGLVPDLPGNPRVERLGGGHLLKPSLKLSAQSKYGKSAWMRARSGATPSPSAQWAAGTA